MSAKDDAKIIMEVIQNPERFCPVCHKRNGVCRHTKAKHLNIDSILKAHSNETLTPHTTEKINREIAEKEQAWLNERDD